MSLQRPPTVLRNYQLVEIINAFYGLPPSKSETFRRPCLKYLVVDFLMIYILNMLIYKIISFRIAEQFNCT